MDYSVEVHAGFYTKRLPGFFINKEGIIIYANRETVDKMCSPVLVDLNNTGAVYISFNPCDNKNWSPFVGKLEFTQK